MKIAFITSGVLPVPSARGGAVETLLDALARENEKAENPFLFTFYSIGDLKAEKMVAESCFKQTEYKFIDIPAAVKRIDETVFLLMNNVFKSKKAKKFRFIFQRMFFIWKCRCFLKKDKGYERVIAVNHPTLLEAVKGTGYLEKNRVIYYAHNDIQFSRYNLSKLRKCERILSVSQYLNDKIKKYMGEKEGSPVFFVVKNGVDLNTFFPYSGEEKKNLRKRFGFNTEDKIILFAGRLVPEKGIQYVVRAVNEMSEIEKNVKLIVVGANSFDLKVRTKFEEELISMTEGKNNISFTGFIDNSKMPDYYNLADVIVLPSICEEAAGLAMIEALACGGALITTCSGGISEYVEGSGAIQLNAKKTDFYFKLKDAILNLVWYKEKNDEVREHAMKNINSLSYSEYYKKFCIVIGKSKIAEKTKGE